MDRQMVSSAVGVHVGFKRGNNEDNFFCNGRYLNEADRETPVLYEDNCGDGLQFYAVFDGMGGEALGEEASLIGAQALGKYQGMLGEMAYHDLDKYITMYVNEACGLIRDRVAQTGGHRIGTTVALLCLEGSRAHCYNIGDSRIYLIRDNEMAGITVDHNYSMLLNQKVKKGVITKEEADSHPKREALISYIGMGGVKYIDVNPNPFKLENGDYIVICSDGLYRSLEETEMKNIILSSQLDVSGTANELISRAICKQKKNQDNTTVVLIKYLDSG